MRLPRVVLAVAIGIGAALAGVAPPEARAARTWYVGDGFVDPALEDVPAACLAPDEARLEDAVERMSPGDTITLCPGTHVLDAGIVLPPTSPGIVPLLTLEGHAAEDTILTRRADPETPAFGLIDAPGWTLAIRDLTLSNGLRTDTGGGGAVAASVVHAERIIVRDSAAPWGGAIAADEASVSQSTFIANTATGIEAVTTFRGEGGAIRATRVSVSDSTFVGNSASDIGTTRGYGGAVHANFLTVAGTTLRENRASYGGALWSGAIHDISGSTLERNLAIEGGGLLVPSGAGPGTISDSVFRENLALEGGAVSFDLGHNSFEYHWTDVTFIGNEAAGFGGAVWFSVYMVSGSRAALLIDRGLFEDNTAGFGGAIAGNTVFAEDSTFRRNTAASRGGAVFAFSPIPMGPDDGVPPIVSLQASTFEGNVAGDGTDGPDELGSGGAISSSINTRLFVDTSTFVANRADEGGAIHAERPASVQFSTFVDNVGVEGSVLAGDHVVMGNTIIAADPSAPACASGLEVEDIGGVLSTDDSCPLTRPESPLVTRSELALSPLADNGGFVDTIRPAPASVAVNGAVVCDVEFVAEALLAPWLDGEGRLFGVAREVLSDDDATGADRPDAACDAGAVERVTSSTIYVGPDGTPDAGGSCTTPDLDSAVVAVERTITGDTVHLCAGTHDLAAPMTPASAITIQGDGPGTSIVDGGGEVPLVEAIGASDVTVRDLTLRNGSSAAGGGAVSADRVMARNVLFEGNEAGFVGGAIAGREIDVSDSTFSGNAALVGGAVLASVTLDLVNSTLEDNHAQATAGAVSATAGTVTHATLVGNDADTGDRAIAGGVSIRNSIVADDTVGDLCGDGVVDGGGNVVTDEACLATDDASVAVTYPELELGSLTDNGGTTETIALGAGSGAIDAGRIDPCVDSTSPARFDQRGISRPQGAGCDAGAYEWVDSSCSAGPAAGNAVIPEGAGLTEDEPFRVSAAVLLAGSSCYGEAELDVMEAPAGWEVTVDGFELAVAPAPNAWGPFSIAFRLTDGDRRSTATLSGVLQPVNDDPAPLDDNYEVDHAATLEVHAPGVLENDEDADGDALTVILVDDVAHGSLELEVDGSFRYTPEAGFDGIEQFRYAASDGEAQAEALVTLTVAGASATPAPSVDPTPSPTTSPTPQPTAAPTARPTRAPAPAPTRGPTATATAAPLPPSSSPSPGGPATSAPTPINSPAPTPSPTGSDASGPASQEPGPASSPVASASPGLSPLDVAGSAGLAPWYAFGLLAAATVAFGVAASRMRRRP